MKELTLKELQQASLAILKDVDKFCTANNIRYSLAYGSLIGAVRHKGFIPWDDDIDIIMPREDYERFASTYTSDCGYKIINCHNEPGCLINFGRVCDMEHTLAVSTIPWIDIPRKSGIWIDVFPLDYVPDDYEQYRRIFDIASYLHDISFNLRRKAPRFHRGMTTKMMYKVLMRHYASKMLSGRKRKYTPQYVVELIEKLIEATSCGKTGRLAQLSHADNINNVFPGDIFDHLVRMPFEDTELLCIADYDTILKTNYGDYMTPPEPEKQTPLQRGYLRFYKR